MDMVGVWLEEGVYGMFALVSWYSVLAIGLVRYEDIRQVGIPWELERVFWGFDFNPWRFWVVHRLRFWGSSRPIDAQGPRLDESRGDSIQARDTFVPHRHFLLLGLWRSGLHF